LLTPFIKYTRK